MRRLVIYILLITLMLASCSTDQTNNGEGHKTPIATYPSSTPTHKETDNPVQTLSTEPPSDGEEIGDISQVGISNNNISSIGNAAYDGEYYYIGAISSPWNDDLYNEGIWRISSDGTKTERLSDDKPIYINIIGDYIYYIKQARNNQTLLGSIVRMKKDGSDRQMLLDGNNTIKMLVIGDWIYFIKNDDRSICKITTKGEKLTKIVDGNCNRLQYKDSWLYYTTYDEESETSTLYKININTCKNPIKLTEGNWYSLILYGDWIYCLVCSENPTFLYRMKEDGSEKVKLFSQSVDSLSVTNDKIYFISETEKHEEYHDVLYEMDLDGKNNKKMIDDPSLYLSSVGVIAGDYIFYSISEGEWMERGRIKKDGSDNVFLRDLLKEFIYMPR